MIHLCQQQLDNLNQVCSGQQPGQAVCLLLMRDPALYPLWPWPGLLDDQRGQES